MQDPDRISPSRRPSSFPDDEYQDEEQTLAPHPSGGLPFALLVGFLAGAFIALFNIVLTYLNAPTYNAAARASQSAASTYAGIIVGLWCLNIVISLLVCFGSGFLLGKTRIERRLGFYAGAMAGVIMYIGSFIVNYIPNYPGHLASTSTANSGNITGGLLTSLVVLIIQGFIGGLFGLWGAWAATRRNPYYQGA